MDIDKRLLGQLVDLQHHVTESVNRGFIYIEEFNGWYGICSACSDSTKDRLRELMLQWPLSSGSKAFPVPAARNQVGMEDVRSSALRKYQYSEPDEMWLTGEYAELRRELLAWLIKTLEESVNVKR